jgi:hypothetical protein
MRVSSVIVPFLIGTLKSTRMKTALPAQVEVFDRVFGHREQAGSKDRLYSFFSRSTQRLE